MADMQLLRALVAEKLAAAAEEIFSAVQRLITEKMLHTSGMSAEQQRAAVHKRLLLVAEEIFMMLEEMMSDYEARVSSSHDDVQQQRRLLDRMQPDSYRTDRQPLSGFDAEDDSSEQQKCDQSSRSPTRIQKTSKLLQIKDVFTETEPVLIHDKASHVHKTQRAEKSTSTTMDTETGREKSVLSSSDQGVLSSRDSEAGSEDYGSNEELTEKSLKSDKRKTFHTQSQGADGCETSGTSLPKGKKTKRNTRKVASTNKMQTVGQSCCRVCGKFFRYKRSFLKHVLTHEHNSRQCGACGKHLDSDQSLKVHLQTHSEENICKDPTGDKQSEAESSDAESKGSDSDEDWRQSEGSDSDSDEDETKERSSSQKPSKTERQRSNKTKGTKNKEYKDASDLKYCCKACSKPFCYRASFLRHVQEDEGDADLCGVCGEHFGSKESLRLHLKTYIRTNDCEVCGKHFDGHQQLEMHMRTHTGEKPFICSVCGKAFAQNGNLMSHMRVHTGERPYACSVCGQSFGFKEYMMAHMRIHTGEKPFLCSVCGKGFRQRGTLRTHMMVHTGEFKHRCGICDKKFYKSGALKIHMRSHTGEKPYLCNVCGKSFPASGSLAKHMGVHEGERTHGCSVCSKAFSRREDLKRHAQTHRDESAQLTSL